MDVERERGEPAGGKAVARIKAPQPYQVVFQFPGAKDRGFFPGPEGGEGSDHLLFNFFPGNGLGPGDFQGSQSGGVRRCGPGGGRQAPGGRQPETLPDVAVYPG